MEIITTKYKNVLKLDTFRSYNKSYLLYLVGGMLMQKQYKIYKLDKDAIDITLPSLNKYKYKMIKNCFVAIEYDYIDNVYTEMLEFMSETATSQFIITTSTYYKLIDCFVKNNLKVYDVKLNDIFVEDNVKILECLREINQREKVEKALNKLFEILRWYNYDEGIDISCATFGITSGKRNIRFYLYNNGVLAVDSEIILEELFTLLENVI